MQSGLPVNIVRENNPTSAFPRLTPDQLGDPILPRGQRTLMKYFNTDAFSTARFICPTCDANAPGDAARNVVRGPGNISLDSSLFKELQFTERYRFQL
jgi:hypothetical protein